MVMAQTQEMFYFLKQNVKKVITLLIKGYFSKNTMWGEEGSWYFFLLVVGHDNFWITWVVGVWQNLILWVVGWMKIRFYKVVGIIFVVIKWTWICTQPNPTLPYPALPCPALPCPIPPHPTLPSATVLAGLHWQIDMFDIPGWPDCDW